MVQEASNICYTQQVQQIYLHIGYNKSSIRKTKYDRVLM